MIQTSTRSGSTCILNYYASYHLFFFKVIMNACAQNFSVYIYNKIEEKKCITNKTL